MGAVSGSALAAAAAISAGSKILGGAIGNMASSDDRDRAQSAYLRAMQEIERIGAPPDLARKIFYKEFQQVGVLTPELEEAVDLAAPQVSQIKEAPEFKEAQLGALRRLTGLSKGRDAELQAQMAQSAIQQAQQTQAGFQRAQQLEQQMGRGGAGLAARMQAASTGAAQAGEQGVQLAAQARRSALEAAGQLGTLGTQVRGQEFDIAKTKAGAADQAAMARFNEAVARQQRNVSTRMGVQQQNLANRQRLSEMNIAQQNAEALRQRQAEAQQYELGMRRAQLMAGAQQGMGDVYQQRAGQTSQMWQGIGSGVGDLGSIYALGGFGGETPAGGGGGAVKGAYRPTPKGF